ncbi:Rec8 like protein-domain-containing protein [Dipodascopsis uninucleata]
MFYSYDILSRKSSGLSTVWLVATLGAKSSLKKVHRKEIMSVRVPDACDLIMHPPQPLALRLSSNLLYGVTSVYYQQFIFFVADVTAAHTKLKRIFYSLNSSGQDIDLNTSQSVSKSYEGNILNDDPSFSIEFGLLPPLPLLSREANFSDDLYSLSIHDSSSVTSRSVLSRSSPIRDQSITLISENNEISDFYSGSNLGFDDDAGNVDFEFGHEGNILGLEEDKRASGGRRESDIPSDFLGIDSQMPVEFGEVPMILDYNDERYRIENSEGLPAGVKRIAEHENEYPTYIDKTIEENSEKPIEKRRKVVRSLKPDLETQLATSALRESRDNYIEHMIKATVIRREREEASFARAHAADFFVYLGDYNGEINKILHGACKGFKLPMTESVDHDHERIDDVIDEDMVRRANTHYATGFGLDDGGLGLQEDAQGGPLFDDVELARNLSSDQEFGLGQSSSLLPWNSLSLSNSNTNSVSLGPSALDSSRRLSSLSSRQRRRLSTMSTGLEQLDSFEEEYYNLPGSDGSKHIDDDFEAQRKQSNDLSMESRLSPMERDSRNFLSYVVGQMDTLDSEVVIFDELVDPAQCSRMVAAQGLMHVLSLASMGILSVDQQLAYGPIDMKISPDIL